MVSIIIPFKDRPELLKCCVDSILGKTLGFFEVILVNNNSKKDETKKILNEIGEDTRIKLLDFNKPFNFSEINNLATAHAIGEYLVFLNNDTEVISENWLEEMLKCFDNEKVGAVGAKLLYPNGTIQHAGIEIKNGDLAHSFSKQFDCDDGDIPFNKKRECIAVTGACMMTRKTLFMELGGFDENNLAIAYNDVDYCFKIREKGLKVMYIPDAKLYHYESATRGQDILKRFLQPKRYKEFLKERAFLRNKWASYFN